MIVDLSTGDESEPEMNVRQNAGQLGGLKGGKARADKLSPEERSAKAKRARNLDGLSSVLGKIE